MPLSTLFSLAHNFLTSAGLLSNIQLSDHMKVGCNTTWNLCCHAQIRCCDVSATSGAHINGKFGRSIFVLSWVISWLFWRHKYTRKICTCLCGLTGCYGSASECFHGTWNIFLPLYLYSFINSLAIRSKVQKIIMQDLWIWEKCFSLAQVAIFNCPSDRDLSW